MLTWFSVGTSNMYTGTYATFCAPKFVQSFLNSATSHIKSHFSQSTRLLGFLKSHSPTGFRFLSDITVIDYALFNRRFSVVYILTSCHKNARLVVRAATNGFFPIISSLTVFQNANWAERECWDMFGVSFIGHTDLRRILTDYGFIGHPLRKDFPLTGLTEIYYSLGRSAIAYGRISLVQSFRAFDFGSPSIIL